jgi:O-antigen/teichoic acid export membrane protein
MKSSLAHTVFRNTFYNFLTQALLIIVALWSLPLIVKGLSNEGFGLLSLFWAFIGYFTLLDFGISRANVKFLSEAIATARSEEIRNIVWTSLSVSFLIGMISGAAIVIMTPYLVNDLFKISISLAAEAKKTFILAGIGIPFMLILGTLKGFQMALQRFEIFNIFQGLTGVLQGVGSVLLLWWGYGLYEVVLLTVGLRVTLSFCAFVILPWLISDIFSTLPSWNGQTLKKLLTFGGWVSVSQVISPLFLYLDRIFIGMFLTLSAVAYYTVPQEALTRMLVIPMSLTTTLFPAMSTGTVILNKENKSSLLYYRSVKYLAIVMLPLILGFIIFARDLVTLWIGKEFAEQSILIFQILAVGLFFNSLAQIPTTALHAFGRPDIGAKFHFIELPLMIILNLLLIPAIGIIGAAITWTFRVMIDAVLLFIATQRKIAQSGWMVSRFSMKEIFSLSVIIGSGFVATAILLTDTSAKAAGAALCIVIYTVATWYYSFDDLDRKFFLQLAERIIK